MKNIILLTFLVLLFPFAYAQNLILQTPLSTDVNETSGLLQINGNLITINDSGGQASLYFIDVSTGNITRSVPVNNATNVDWEALTSDDTYVYIGDIGNNYGNRIDLKIYRIPINDVLNNRSVNAEIIHFSYANQTDFSSQHGTTNFDAESLIVYNNHLYIFTKNWGNGQTNIYELPKTLGTFSATLIDNFNPQGLITDAVYNSQTQCVMLIGYTHASPFVVKLSGFSNNLFSNGQIEKVNVQVPTGYSKQIEGITNISANEYYVSAETYNKPTALYSFNEGDILRVTKNASIDIKIYPNPASNFIHTNASESHTLHIYDLTGKLMLTTNQSSINIEKLASGIYVVQIINAKEQIVGQTTLFVRKCML